MAISFDKDNDPYDDLASDDCACRPAPAPVVRSGLRSVAMALLGITILAACLAFAYIIFHSDLKESDRGGYLVADGIFLWFSIHDLLDRI